MLWMKCVVREPSDSCSTSAVILAEHYGKDLVFAHMTIGQEGFADVFGKDFETLFFEWAADNDAWCVANGIVLGPMEE